MSTDKDELLAAKCQAGALQSAALTVSRARRASNLSEHPGPSASDYAWHATVASRGFAIRQLRDHLKDLEAMDRAIAKGGLKQVEERLLVADRRIAGSW